MQEQQASATSSAQAAYATLTDKLIDAWGESQLKDFCDRNGIPVPQGSKLNQIRALVRKHRAEILGDTLTGSAKSAYGAATGSAASAYGAATSSVGSGYSKATDTVSQAAADAFDKAIGAWSETRLKAYLDARGVPVPQASKADELRALVRKHAHKAASGYTAWTFDDWTYDNLRDYVLANGDAAGKKVANTAGATRDQLLAAAQSGYASASAAGGNSYASVTSYLSKATDSAKAQTFETWSESDLKSYLDSYGVPVPQGSTLNELRALARRQWTYFKYGTSTPTDTVFAKIGENAKAGWDWIKSQLFLGADVAQDQAIKAGDKVKEGADAYQTGAQKAGDKVKQEL